MDNIDFLSQIFIQRNETDKAIRLLQESDELINKGQPLNQEFIKIYSLFCQLYNKTKNFERIAFYQQKYIQLKDSVYSEQLTNNLMKLDAEYQERENKAKIASQEQILSLKERVIRQQNITNIIIGGIALLLIMLATILYRANRQKRMINKILDQKVNERTIALEKSRETLLQASMDVDELIESTSIDINTSLQTIKLLCTHGLQKVNDPNARQYISKIDSTSDQLAFTLRNLQELSSVNKV